MSDLQEEKGKEIDSQIKLPNLWNKNFTILVLGGFISMVGYTCASFVIGLSVFDDSQDILRYALTLVALTLPNLIITMTAGTLFDRFSRRKMIPRIDYCYSLLFFTAGLLMHFNLMQYWMFLICALIFGMLNGTYMVAFESFFPLLTTTQNTRKAYSVNSMIYPIASIITLPLTLFGYDLVGPVALFLGAGALLAINATMELNIIVREPHIMRFRPEEQAKLPPSPRELEHLTQGKDISTLIAKKDKGNFFTDFKEGVKYIAGEKGLLAITIYFFIISVCSGVYSAFTLPFFRSRVDFEWGGMWAYIIVFGASTLGRLIGANVQYRVKFPKDIRFNVAVCVYIATNVFTIILFHLPVWAMAGVMLIEGSLSVTSYNIRISSTSTYVPDEKRGRFNGTFLAFNMTGSVLGQLTGGFLSEIENLAIPLTISITFLINLAFVFIVVIPAKKHISPIYNRDL